jgi:hypothetical protein
VKFLSQEFLDALPDADRAPFGDATGVISVKTEGGPDGKVAVTVELEHGRVVGARPKASKEAAVELAAPYELAVARDPAGLASTRRGRQPPSSRRSDRVLTPPDRAPARSPRSRWDGRR